MSADFEKVLIKDPRLDVSDSIKYAVIKGGQNVTCAQYKAISETDSQLVFNIQVPSEQTIIDRRVLLQTTLSLSLTNAADTGNNLYGIYGALASFPLHQLMTVLSVTINNNTVSLNVRDALPAIIRLLEEDDLVNWNGTTPTFADTAANYLPAGVNLTNPNAAYWAVSDPRNAHRGCFMPSANPVNAGAVEKLSWLVTEPLLISPFIFANLKSNSQGFYGIQNMNIVINIGNTQRVYRGPCSVNTDGTVATAAGVQCPSYAANGLSVVAGGNTGGTSTLFSGTQLLFTFLTPHPSDLMPARNIVPFYELPRYITSISASPNAGLVSAGGKSLAPQDFSFVLNSLQLNQIPDKLILYVRIASGYQGYGSPDVAFPITKININFNNNSGILASATPVDLWQMSRKNGLTSSWNEWSGAALQGAATTFLANPAVGAVAPYATVGSYLVLEFGKDIQLTEDFYAAGSLGNFNLQINMTCQNYNQWSIAKSSLEAVLITMNSGVFVCERGTSSTYTGILTKQDVLEASQQEHYTHDDVARLVGGGFFGALKSAASNLVRQAAPALGNMARQGVASLANQGAQFVQGQVERHAPQFASQSQALLNRGVSAVNSAADRGINRVQGEVMSRLPPDTRSRRPKPASRRRGRGYVPEELEGHY